MSGEASLNKVKLPTNKRFYAFVCACLVQLIVWCDEVAFVTLVPYWSAEMGFDATQIASIQSSYLLGYFPMLFLGGVIADYIGPKKCLLIATGACGILSFCMLFCHTYGPMYWRNLLFGIFFGMNWGPGMKLLGNWLPAQERAQKNSIWSLFTSVASIVIGPVSLQIASRAEFNYAFVVVAILSIPVFILTLFTADNPLKHKSISQEEVNYISEGIDMEALANDKISLKAAKEAVSDGNVWLVFICVVFATCSTWALGPWGTMIMLDVYGMSPDLLSTLGAILPLIPVAFSFTTGFWLNKVFKGNVKMLFFAAPFIGGIPYLICGFFPQIGGVAVNILGTLGACTNAFGWGGAGTYWAAYSKPHLWGTLNGLGAMFQTAMGYLYVNFSAKLITESHGIANMGGFARIYIIAGLTWFICSIASLFVFKVTTTDTWETVAARKAEKKAGKAA